MRTGVTRPCRTDPWVRCLTVYLGGEKDMMIREETKTTNRILAGIAAVALGFFLGTVAGERGHPAIDCQEDEVYWWVANDLRGCQPIDDLLEIQMWTP